ncbi:hypothetical protein POTOM_017019 [Populus tomentosa]|nr:hypothetical protein POTOM_017019 [Populus tomentosa]
MDNAFKYIIQNGGLASEDNDPYQGVDGTCSSEKAASIAAEITGHEDVPKNNENALLQAVAQQPVSVIVDGGGHDFMFYKSGVFNGDCGTAQSHAGTNSDGTDYWLVKNSWGTGLLLFSLCMPFPFVYSATFEAKRMMKRPACWEFLLILSFFFVCRDESNGKTNTPLCVAP